MTDFSNLIASRIGVAAAQVAATIALLNENATIPFIARYRKERTGSLDEVQISQIADEYHRFLEIDDRKATILKTIDEQGKLTPELRQRINLCWNATELEDIYLPYKPHRKTRADLAREQGYEPLAKAIFEQKISLDRINPGIPVTPGTPNWETALQGARDIIAEWISQDEHARNDIRREFSYTATITTKLIKGKESDPEAQKYRDYFAINEPLRRISSHRLLAIRRAENEGFIRVDISPDSEKALDKLAHRFLRTSSDTSYQVELAMEDSYKRLLKPAIETEFASSSKEKADTEAIRVFADNLRQLLLESPLGQKRVLALDPGFRTGCKLVVLSAQGDLLHHTVIFLNTKQATTTLQTLIHQYQIEAIAIGNGTASRESEQMVRVAIENYELGIKNDTTIQNSKFKTQNSPQVFVVSESGASVYSASKTAREEFPNEDVTVQNELLSMSPSQRSSQAINMLLYGTYTGMGTTANTSGNPLYSFLNSQINRWAANTIKGVDLTFGVNQYGKGEDAAKSTSYSYKISKSLFNDRFKIVVGGSYNPGGDTDDNFANSLLNDISFVYMLNQSGSMSVKLFRHTGYESILEGEVTETGGAFVMKRKISSLKNFFRFGRRKRGEYQNKNVKQDTVIKLEEAPVLNKDINKK